MTSDFQNNAPKQALPLIGILGDGQLAMMMTQAYQKLGGQVFVLGTTDDGPASTVADRLVVGNPNSLADLSAFYQLVDIVTLENEFYDSQLLAQASEASQTRVYPDPKRFGLIEDKLSEKHFFQAQGVAVADFFEVKTADDLLDEAGYLKLAKGGYDGIGTYKVENKAEAVAIYQQINSVGTVLFERAIDYKKELSLIVVADGSELVFYPLVETQQQAGTCRYVVYPCGIDEEYQQQAREQIKRIMQALDTKGVFAFELFLTEDNQLILNESAPRPHNSGHITMDSMNCSQFENHMRAVAGLPILQPEPQHPSMTMVNLLGTRDGDFVAQQLIEQVNDANCSITLYRKLQSRVKRKMGHINLWGENQRQRAESFVKNLQV